VICESAGGYAMLLDSWAEGWSASIDGEPARIERADGLVRAVRIGAGRHAIEFRYRTPGLRTGMLVSALAWLALAAAAFWVRMCTRSASRQQL